MKHVMPEETAREYVKFAAIVAGIVALAMISAAGDYSLMNIGRWIMGWFFIVFGMFKLVGYQMFVAMFPGYDLVAKRSRLYAQLYPFIEIGLGLMYILALIPLWRNVLAALIMGIGLVGVVRHIQSQGQIPCACLGNIIKLPVGKVTAVEDGAMLVMASLMIVLQL